MATAFTRGEYSQAMLIMFQSGIKDTLIALLFCVCGVQAPLCPVLN